MNNRELSRTIDGLKKQLAKAIQIRKKIRLRIRSKKDQKRKNDIGAVNKATIYCLEYLASDGKWYLWDALRKEKPYSDALAIIQRFSLNACSIWKLPGGEMDASKWRIMRYSAIQGNKIPTWRVEQEHLKPPCEQQPLDKNA